MLDDSSVQRLYRKADAARWSVSTEVFLHALEASVARAFGASPASRREVERYLDGLHLKDLALACACVMGTEAAWEYFVSEHRSVLYRAADSLDRSGAAREIADALYAELYGLRDDRSDRASLFRYFHGRSSLATWLRAVLAQRYVDRLRADRRTSPLDDETVVAAIPIGPENPELGRFSALVGDAMREAIARLAAKDRLRLRLYYEQDLTLAQIGRLTSEHEATVSRRIAKTRKTLRNEIEQQLRVGSKLSESEIAVCCEAVAEDAGPLDIRELFGSASGRKNPALDRSK